jgi:multidrug efflux pump subunit AcrA (membrane-fusion protein)
LIRGIHPSIPGTALAVLAALFAASCGGSRAGAGSAGGPGDDLRVRRGEFVDRFVLTGELQAVDASLLSVPRVPSSQTSIRWMVEDGAVVRKGERLVEFDNTSFTGDLEEKRLARDQAVSDLAQREAELAALETDRELQVEQRRIALEKARFEAAVPRDLLPLRDWQERQLALRRAEIDHAKAMEDLEAQRKSGVEELEQKRIALDRTRREIAAAEEAIDALVLEAPQDGIAVIADHPWEGRKLQVGDALWSGLPVVTIPELDRMQVAADLSDVDDGRIARGMPAVSRLDAYPDEAFPGRVVDVGAVAQEAKRRSVRRTFPVRVSLERADADKMRPGMSVRVEVETGRAADALLAPRAGLDLESDPPRARLAGGGEAEVALGPCNALECVVESGLSEGDRLRRGA